MPAAQLGLGDWTLEPTVITGLVVLVLAYLRAHQLRLLSSDDDVSPWLPGPGWRQVYFTMGVLTFALALLSPIDRGGDAYLLSIHMVQHLLLMIVGPPLLLLGIVGMRVPPQHHWRRLRSFWRWITRPWPATLLFNAVLLVWHVPTLYNTTLNVEPLHVVEHLTFIAAGMVLWWPVVDPLRAPDTRTVSPLEKIGMLTLAGIPPTLLGFIFCLAGRPFYDFYAQAPRLWGVSPVTDQQIAGVVMLGLGNLIYFVPISVIFLRMFEGTEDEAALEA